MQRMLSSAVVLAAGFAFAIDAEANNPFCADRGLIIRSAPRPPDPDLSLLLTSKEKQDPDSLQKLLVNDGPYGHSELGFRYLTRAFGYRGGFEDPDAAETWFVEQLERNEQFRNADKLWDKWVRGSDIILRADGESKKPELNAFFKDKIEAMQFSQCLATDIALKRCENYSLKQLTAGTRVYFGGDSSHAPCAIHYLGGDHRNATPDSVSYSKEVKKTSQMKLPSGEVVITTSSTEKSDWAWKNPNHWDPNSANGIKEEGGKAHPAK